MRSLLGGLRLFGVFARLGAMNEVAYRANFWVQMVESALTVGSTLALVGVVVGQTDALAGWRPAELLTVVGVYFVVFGLINFVVAPSFERFMEEVREGTLDFTLTKPADAQLLVSISQVRVWKLIDVVLGLGILGFALVRLGASVDAGEALGFVLALLAGAAIVYSFWLVLATLAFWLIRIENILMIFWMVYSAGRWPVTIYPGWLRWALTVIVPVAFAVTVPAQAVTGRLNASTLALAAGLAVVMLLGSRLLWRTGLRHYGGASA